MKFPRFGLARQPRTRRRSRPAVFLTAVAIVLAAPSAAPAQRAPLRAASTTVQRISPVTATMPRILRIERVGLAEHRPDGTVAQHYRVIANVPFALHELASGDSLATVEAGGQVTTLADYRGQPGFHGALVVVSRTPTLTTNDRELRTSRSGEAQDDGK